MDDLSHAPSYYAATATAYAPYPALRGTIDVDVVVIGGGFTGLSAALHLAERGYHVTVLEAARIGWGASGRNGGQLIPGLRKGASELVRMFGLSKAKELFFLSLEALDLVRERITRHHIACDFKQSGHLLAATKARDISWMTQELTCLERDMHYNHAAFLPPAEVAQHICGKKYHGGLLDKRGGHLHPLNYAIGLAKAAQAAGVKLFENSRVHSINQSEKIIVHSASGAVSARYGVLACDAYLGTLHKSLASRMMPVGNYIIATEPLADAHRILPTDLPVSDTNFVLDYFRLSADKRLLFSGGEKYSATPPKSITDFVRPHMLAVFPQLKKARIDYAWGGLVSVTLSRLPHFGRERNLFFAQGYSGQGVALTTLAGKLIAEAVSGTAERFDIFAQKPPPPFPGGALLRSPLYVLGMLWYALRDRL